MKAALYLHFPFCLQKCRYCSFNSLPLSQIVSHEERMGLTDRYLKALQKEISFYADDKWELSSIYCGGGTPTVLNADSISQVLSCCSRHFHWSADIEISVEANPGTVTLEKLKDIKKVGVNRLSLGAQSFHPEELKLLGRTHQAGEIVESYEAARDAGFDNINLDLIYGLPGQSLASWSDTLKEALRLSPEHLSVYGLSLEASTPLAQDIEEGKLEPSSEDLQIAMWEKTAKSMAAAGYVRYEISNYAQPGRECRHNITYWENRPYLGVGAGAHGYLERLRYADESDLQIYMNRVEGGEFPRVFEERQSDLDERVCTIIMGLRLTKGLSRKGFIMRFGRPFEDFYGKELSLLVGEGLLGVSEDAIFLTEGGRLLANYVLSHFV
ncbi:MAG TPA: coproporphyrinogen III oxidase [Peptococcaceae bacterium]|nr:coproporphyrinogen III oxidase [Peptococcaceae bacterium]